jgi:hypothetical protein
MIDNVSQFIESVARTDLGRAARRSARTIWNAHRAAFVTTRHEAGKVLVLAFDEGQKFNVRGRTQALQERVTRVIRNMGRGSTVSTRAKPRTARKAKRRTSRRAA